MKSAILAAMLLVFGAVAAPVSARGEQPTNARRGGEINPFPGDDSEALLNSLDAAQRDAERAGDAELTCDQLGQEVTAIALDPQVQAVVESLGGSPQAALAQLKKQQRRQITTVVAYAAVTVLSQIATRVPGLGIVTGAAQDALGRSVNAQQAAMTAQSAAQAARITPILPQVMRGSRVQELAALRQCAFLSAPPPE